MLRRNAAIILCTLACGFAVTAMAGSTEIPTFGSENRQVLQFLEERVRQDPDDFVAQNRLGNIYLDRLRETGGYEWLQKARAAARRSLGSVEAAQNADGLALLARVEHESHQFAAARDAALELTKIEPRKSRAFTSLGDALLELGDVADAAKAYEQARERGAHLFEVETREARVKMARGAFAEARQHFEAALAAAADISPSQPQFAIWCHLQLGQLAFRIGEWERAEKHYAAALKLHADDAHALEHLAELRGAQEKYEEAIALYDKVIDRLPRPEFWQARGDLAAAAGKPPEAASWYARAREGYLRDVEAGNAHYYHHLAGFFSDAEPNPAEAVKWARRDLELRRSAGAHDALAWALFRAGEFVPAAEAARAALGSGTKDAQILFHAGMIFLAAGDAAAGKEMLAEAARINPRHTSFHVHR